MAPTTRVCLSFSEASKNICIDVPTLEGLKEIAQHFHRDVIMKHPYISAAVLLLWSFYPQFPFQAIYTVFWVIPRNIIVGFLTCFGLREDGVIRDASGHRSRYYYVGNNPRNGFYSALPSYGTVNRDPSTSPNNHSASDLFWRFIGWLILYASLVVLLKYGGD